MSKGKCDKVKVMVRNGMASGEPFRGKRRPKKIFVSSTDALEGVCDFMRKVKRYKRGKRKI